MIKHGQIMVDRQTYLGGGVGRLRLALMMLAAFLYILAGCSGDKSTVDERSGAGESSKELIQKGERHLANGQYRASIIEARNAIQRNPSDIAGYVLIAKVFNSLEQGKLAAMELDKYQGDKDTQYELQYIRALLNQRKYHSAQLAIDALGEKLLPAERLEWVTLKARSSYGLMNLDLAGKLFHEMLELAESEAGSKANALVGLAKVSLTSGDEEKASQYLQQSMAVKENSEALLLQGTLAFRGGNFDDAEDLLTQALLVLPVADMMLPLRIRVLEGLTKILIQQGRSSEALVYSKIIADANPEAQELKAKFAQAMEIYQSGDMVEAEELLNELYQQSGKSDVGGRMLGVVNYAQGDFEKANTYFSEHLDPETVSPQLLKIWAGSELQLKRPEKAAQILQQKLDVTPDNADLLSLYSLVLLAGGDYEGALVSLEKAIEVDPAKQKVRLSLAQYLNSKRRFDEALIQLEKAFKSLGSERDVQASYLRQLLALGESDKAWQEVQALVKRYPGNAETFALAGTIALKLKENKISRKYFDKALVLQNDLASARLGLAQLHVANKDYERALSAFKGIIASHPEELYGYNGLVSTALLMGKEDQALQQLKAKSEENKEVAAPIAVLAGYSLKNGDMDNAITLAEQALERDQSLPYAKKVLTTALYRKGLSEASLSQFDKARKSILEAVRIEPNNMRLLGVLAEIEISAGKHREAAKVISQIETLFPNAPTATILKGDLGMAKKMLVDAEDAYLQGWEAQPSDLAGRKLYELYTGKRDVAKASQLLEEWRKQLPQSGAPILLMALQKQKEQDFSAAIKLYEELLIIAPKSVLGHNNLAWLYSEVGDQRALKTAEKAYLLAPKNGPVADTYGWLLVGSGELVKGINILELAVKYAPNNEEIKGHLEQARAKL